MLFQLCTMLTALPRAEWLVGGDLQRLVLVITNARTEEVTERWQFEVETETELGLDGYDARLVFPLDLSLYQSTT